MASRRWPHTYCQVKMGTGNVGNDQVSPAEKAAASILFLRIHGRNNTRQWERISKVPCGKNNHQGQSPHLHQLQVLKDSSHGSNVSTCGTGVKQIEKVADSVGCHAWAPPSSVPSAGYHSHPSQEVVQMYPEAPQSTGTRGFHTLGLDLNCSLAFLKG